MQVVQGFDELGVVYGLKIQFEKDLVQGALAEKKKQTD